MGILPRSFMRRDAAARRASKKLGWDISRSRLTYTVYDLETQDVLGSDLSLNDVEDLIRKAHGKVRQMPNRRIGGNLGTW